MESEKEKDLRESIKTMLRNTDIRLSRIEEEFVFKTHGIDSFKNSLIILSESSKYVEKDFERIAMLIEKNLPKEEILDFINEKSSVISCQENLKRIRQIELFCLISYKCLNKDLNIKDYARYFDNIIEKFINYSKKENVEGIIADYKELAIPKVGELFILYLNFVIDYSKLLENSIIRQ